MYMVPDKSCRTFCSKGTSLISALSTCKCLHLLRTQHCFFRPCPLNFFLSRQYTAHSQYWYTPHTCVHSVPLVSCPPRARLPARNVSPRGRVGSGDETSVPQCVSTPLLLCTWFFLPTWCSDQHGRRARPKQAIDTYVWVVPVVLRLVTTVEEAVLVVAVVNGAPIVRVPENSLA